MKIFRAKEYDVYIITIIASCYFIFLKIHQFISYGAGGELADYELVLWNTLHGRFLQMSCSNLSFLSEHFSPILLLLLPFYVVAQSPYTLLVIQAIVCAIAIVPLYKLVAEYTSLRWTPIAISLAYFFSRVVNYGLMYDVHPEIFYPFIFFSAFLALRKFNWNLFYIFLFLAAIVKEDSLIAIFGVGLFMYYSGYKKHGIITSLGSLIVLSLIVFIIIPFFNTNTVGADYKFISYWSGYGSTQREVMLNFLNPVRHLLVIFSPVKLSHMFNLFSVFLFLPFLSWRALLFLILPNWFMLYSSDNHLMNVPLIYYGLLITPLLFIAALMGISKIASRWNLYRDRIFFWLATLIFIVQLGNSRIFKQVLEEDRNISERYKTIETIINSIPAGASVSAQVYLVPHLPPHQMRTSFPKNIENTDYILLDKEGNTWPFSEKGYKLFVDSLQGSKKWLTLLDTNGFILFKNSR
jgi:uncharacterized membrane protein